MAYCHYSILDLDDNTEYGTASIPAIDDEKIHEFGSRVLVANGFEGRAAVVFQFGDDTAKACPRANEVASFFDSSGSKEKPFLVHLKKQQHATIWYYTDEFDATEFTVHDLSMSIAEFAKATDCENGKVYLYRNGGAASERACAPKNPLRCYCKTAATTFGSFEAPFFKVNPPLPPPNGKLRCCFVLFFLQHSNVVLYRLLAPAGLQIQRSRKLQ